MLNINVFLLYCGKDAPFAASIKNHIAPQRLQIFDVGHNVPLGVPWLEFALSQMHAADIVIAVLSADLRVPVNEIGGPNEHEVLLRKALELFHERAVRLVITYARAVALADSDPMRPLLVPPAPIAPQRDRDACYAAIAQIVGQYVAEVRRELSFVPENLMNNVGLSPRPSSGELLLSRYRLIQRIRHDPWMSEWIAVDEGFRDSMGVTRTVLVHLFGLRSIGARNDALRDRVFKKVGRLHSEGLAGLGKIVEPRAADGARHFFIVEDVSHSFSPEYGVPITLRAAVARRNLGIHWIPQLLHVGQQLATLHCAKKGQSALVHGGVTPDAIMMDLSGGPLLIGLNPFAGESIWRPLLDAEPTDRTFLPPNQDIATPSGLNIQSEVYGFAATGLYALLGGQVNVTLSWSEICETLPAGPLKEALLNVLGEAPVAPCRSVEALCEALRKAYVSITTEAKPTMLPVAEGEFWMGRKADDTLAKPREKPRRRVRVSTFSIGRDPVSQSLYQLVMGGSPTVRSWPSGAPASSVSFFDAVEFCNRLSRLFALTPAYEIKEGQVFWDLRASGYRLPTEAEWEYAAAGPCAEQEEARDYPWGNDPPIKQVCWNGEGHGHTLGNQRGPCVPGVHVGGDSPFGVRDMAGGLSEWCWDWYEAYSSTPLGDGPLVNPVGPAASETPVGLEARPYRVLHGGWWIQNQAHRLRNSARFIEDQEKRQWEIGFRIACGPILVPEGREPIVD